jgi:hypothetical protein
MSTPSQLRGEAIARGVAILDAKLSPKQGGQFFDFAESTTLKRAKDFLEKDYNIEIGINTISRWLQKQRRKRVNETRSQILPVAAAARPRLAASSLISSAPRRRQYAQRRGPAQSRDLFTAIEFELATGQPRGSINWTSLNPRGFVDRPHGRVPGYGVDELTPDLRDLLNATLRKTGCRSVAEVLRARAKSGEKLGFLIADLPKFTQQKAERIKTVLFDYFRELDSGSTELLANQKARGTWLVQFYGKHCDERTIRRRARRVSEFGGPTFAPIEAYCDVKSTPHREESTATASSIAQRALTFSSRLVSIHKSSITPGEKQEIVCRLLFGRTAKESRSLMLLSARRQPEKP